MAVHRCRMSQAPIFSLYVLGLNVLVSLELRYSHKILSSVHNVETCQAKTLAGGRLPITQNLLEILSLLI